MLTSLALCLFLLASPGCRARPGSPSGSLGKDGENQELPRMLNIHQYLKELMHSTRQLVSISSKESDHQAEVKTKQMDQIRQQVYDALAPENNDDWDLKKTSFSGALTNRQRPCWGSLLTCLKAGVPSSFQLSSFPAPAVRFPCYGIGCYRKVPIKPLRRPMYVPARPYGGVHRHNIPWKAQKSPCHHNRILPTYVPIKINKIPTKPVSISNSPATKTSYVDEKKQPSTTQTFFTLPETLYNLAAHPSTTTAIPDLIGKKDLQFGSVNLENEILGITEKHYLNHSVNTEQSIQKSHPTVTFVTTQSPIPQNIETSTSKSITMTQHSVDQDIYLTTKSFNTPMNVYFTEENSVGSRTTSISNIPDSTNSLGEVQTSRKVINENPTEVTNRILIDTDLTADKDRSTILKLSETDVDLLVNPGPRDESVSPVTELTSSRTTLKEDPLTTQYSFKDSNVIDNKANPSNSTYSSYTISPTSKDTTLQSSTEENLTTANSALDTSPQELGFEPNLNVNNLFPDQTIWAETKITTPDISIDEDFLTTQVSLLQPDIRTQHNPVVNSSIISQYTTYRATLIDEIPTTEPVTSKYIESGQESEKKLNLPLHTTDIPSFHDPEYFTKGSSHTTLNETQEAFSKSFEVDEPKNMPNEEYSTEYPKLKNPDENSVGGDSYYETTETSKSSIVDDPFGRTEANTVQSTVIDRDDETSTTETSETTTFELDYKSDSKLIFERSTVGGKHHFPTNVPEQKENTINNPLNQYHGTYNNRYQLERARFSDLEKEQDGIWKFTSELESYDDRFPNDESAAFTLNENSNHSQRSRRAVDHHLRLEPHMTASTKNSSLSLTTKNNLITINSSNIVELWPVIRDGYKNNAFGEEDKEVIRSMFGQIKSLLGEEALAELTEAELQRDETSWDQEERQGDYEYGDSEEDAGKRSRRLVQLERDLAKRPQNLRSKLITHLTKATRDKRSTGSQQPVSEAAAILALLTESGRAVQLDRADDEDDDEYEYYGGEEYSDPDEYEDEDEEYDDNPSFKELLFLAKKHRKRQEAKL